MKLLILFMLISVTAFSQNIYVPNNENINTEPNGHTLLKFNRSGNYIYISFDKYYTGNNSEYPVTYQGTVYYVSSSGSDSNNGLTKTTPFLTVAKGLSMATQNGDAVLLKSSDSFISMDTVKYSGNSTSPITIGAYGSMASKPKIYGSVSITNWELTPSTTDNPNIYQASFTPTGNRGDITQLFVNGKRQTLARYPNTGYATITSLSNSTQFGVVSLLNSGINFTGSSVFLRPNEYMSEVEYVAANISDTTIAITSAPSQGAIAKGQGAMFMNKLAFLDAPGEWFYDSETDLIYFWAAGNANPNTFADVRGSVLQDGISIQSKSYITVDNLEILHQKRYGMNVGGSGTNYITISNNTIDGQEGYGIYSTYGRYWTISDNNITNQNANGIQAFDLGHTRIKDNTIRKVGMFEAMGIMGTTANNAGSGMEIRGGSGTRNIIEYNRIDSTGYNGIFWTNPADIRFNYLTYLQLAKSDGAAIYTGGTLAPPTGSRVSRNIIDKAFGNINGSNATREFGEGIYLDEPVSGIDVDSNTVISCYNAGILMHDAANNNIRHNTIFDCRYSILTNIRIADYQITISSERVYLNAVYSNNNQTFLILTNTSAAVTTISVIGSGNPGTGAQTYTKVSGNGPATLTGSAFTKITFIPNRITNNISITGYPVMTPTHDPRQLHISYTNFTNTGLLESDVYTTNTYVNGIVAGHNDPTGVNQDKVYTTATSGYITFPNWQTFIGSDAGNIQDPLSGSRYLGTDLVSSPPESVEIQRVFYNATREDRRYTGGIGKDENGTIVTTFDLEPFTSKYLRGTAANMNAFVIQ